MLSYEKFKKKIVEEILNYLPEQYKDFSVKVNSSQKINVVMETIDIFKKKTDGSCGGYPSLSLQNAYQRYQHLQDLDAILVEIAANYVKMQELQDCDFDLSREYAEKNVVMQVIPTDRNYLLLQEVPHRELYDFSVIYRIIFGVKEGKLMSMCVTNYFAEKTGLEEDDLFQLAFSNTEKILPPKIKPIKIPDNKKIWIVTNEYCLYGAASMLSQKILEKLSSKAGGSLYLFAMSIHEITCIPAMINYMQFTELSKLVRRIMEHLKEDEKFMETIYYYDHEKRELKILEEE